MHDGPLSESIDDGLPRGGMPRLAADKYVTKVRKPDDVDEFWDDVLAQTAKIPLDAEVNHVPLRSSEAIDVFEVFYTSLDDVRIAGWYAVPKERGRPPAGPATGARLQHGASDPQELGQERLRHFQRSSPR